MALRKFGVVSLPFLRILLGLFTALGTFVTPFEASALRPTCESLFIPRVTYKLTSEINRPLLTAFLNAVRLGKGQDGISGEALVPAFTAFTATQLFAMHQEGLTDFPYVVGQTRRGHVIALQFAEKPADPYFKIFVIKDIGIKPGLFFDKIEAKDKSPIWKKIAETNGTYEQAVARMANAHKDFIAVTQYDSAADLNTYYFSEQTFLIRRLAIHSRKLTDAQILEFLESLRDI